MKENKPKCFGCDEVGMETEYYWHVPHGGDGHLWHSSCIIRGSMLIAKNRPAPEGRRKVFIQNLFVNNAVLRDHVEKKNIVEIEKFVNKKLKDYTVEEVKEYLNL